MTITTQLTHARRSKNPSGATSSPRMNVAAAAASAACASDGSTGPAAGITLDRGRMTQGGAHNGASTKLPWNAPRQ